MAHFLLKHLANSLTRQLSQITWATLKSSSPTASAYRCLSTLTTAPNRLFMLPVRVKSIQPPLSGSSTHLGKSLLGQCQHLTCLQPCAGMKTKTALKRRCKDCFIVRRRGRLFVFCKTNPRHKQRQG